MTFGQKKYKQMYFNFQISNMVTYTFEEQGGNKEKLFS